MAKYDGWLEEPNGTKWAIPDTANNCASSLRFLIDQRVYERAYKNRTDGKWVYRYFFTEPPKGTEAPRTDDDE
jgi:hypothetical protein